MFQKLSNIIKRFTSEQFEHAVNTALNESPDNSSQSIYIDEEGSLSISSVWACVRILSDTVGTLPIHLYHRTNSGREAVNDHPCNRIILRPNSYSNRFDLMHHLILSCALWGNGYVRIIRDKSYRPTRLILIHPTSIEPVKTKDDNVYYRLSNGDTVASDDIIHIKWISINGYKGKSPIAVHRDNLALTLAAQDYGEKFFSQGGNTSGVFEYPATLKDDQYNRLKYQLTEQTIGLKNAHRPMLLEGGMKYNRITIPPEDAQFIATRKFQKTEIATIYGIPPHMIADLERSTNNNIEHQGMEFVQYCLMPYIIKIEEEFNRKLLRDDEFFDYYFSFGLNGLLRGDAKTRSEYYKNMNMIGALSANEIRSLEEMNEYDGGDEYFVQMNMQTVTNAKNNINGKTATTITEGD